MKKILVTGSTGFIGKALVAKLSIDKNIKIVEFKRNNQDDILDLESITKYFNCDITHVIHLAGSTIVSKSWDEPANFIQTNVLGTANILEICRSNSCPMIYVSAYVYGDQKDLPINVESNVKPNNPYALSKYLGEKICKFYSENYDVPTTSLRLFNVYGENQSENFLISSVINQMLNEEITEITVNNLITKRDYVFLKDVVEAIICSLKHNNGGSKTYNIASGHSLSVEEVIEVIQTVCKTDKKINDRNIIRVNEIMDTKADITNTILDLNWKPKTDFMSGIKAIVAAQKMRSSNDKLENNVQVGEDRDD